MPRGVRFLGTRSQPSGSEFSGRRLDFRQNPRQPAGVLTSSGGQSANGQPSTTQADPCEIQEMVYNSTFSRHIPAW